MAGSIKLYGGKKGLMPLLSERAPGYCTDTRELYIGSPSGNVLMASEKSASGIFEGALIMPSQGTRAYELSSDMGGGLYFADKNGVRRRVALASDSIAPLGSGADINDIRKAFNGLLEAMKAAGAMKE